MTLTTVSGAALLTPEQVDALVIRPLDREAACLNPAVSRRVVMTSSVMRLPWVSADPVVGIFAEGAEIDFSDVTLSDVDLVVSKYAGISSLTSEALQDESPDARAVVADGLRRDLGRRLDQSFFGTTMAGSASVGLSSRPTTGPTGVTPVTATLPLANLDAFIDAQVAADDHGTPITAWVMNGATLGGLRRLRSATGSLVPLLGGTDAGVVSATPNASRVALFGVPVVTTPYLANNVIFGAVAGRMTVGIRRDVELAMDSSVLFTSDRHAVRLTCRIGWATPDPAAWVRLVAA